MNSDLWRWADPQGQQRRVRLDELRAALAGGHIAPNTPVWKSGWQSWQPAHDVPELTSASLGAANGVVLNIPPPPLAMLAVQQQYEASSGSVPAAPPKQPDEEPPPPPPYVPLPVKAPSIHPSSTHLKTQLGGSAYVPATPGVTPATAASSVAPAGATSVPKLGPSLPTAIGLPPPPEVLAMGAAAAARAATPTNDAVGELIGPNNNIAPGQNFEGGHHTNASIEGGLRPSDPFVHDRVEKAVPDDGFDDDAVIGVPPKLDLKVILDDIALIRAGKPPKNKLIIGVAGALTLCVLLMLIAGLVSLVSGSSSSDKEKAIASASASAKSTPPIATSATTTTAKLAAPTTAPPKSSGPMLGDCTATGDAKTIAPRAQIASGIEAYALGSEIALGFAPGPREAVATLLDPSSLSPTSTARAKPAGGDTRRVTPILVNGKLTAIADSDRKGDKPAGRRVVAASTLIDIGSADESLVWAPHGRDSFASLFTLGGEGAVEALRATALTDRKGIAIAFRRGNSINIGVAKGENVLEADGELSKLPGLGQVGSPAIAASGEYLIVAWADRAGASDGWGIRWVKMKIGGRAQEPMTFKIPEGGLGEQAMSPSLASLGGGRFLLAWTEGPVSNHQIRAMTIGADGLPSGSVMAISGSGVNAGQPAAVVGADGRGVVAFLAAKSKALEVQATPISCPPR